MAEIETSAQTGAGSTLPAVAEAQGVNTEAAVAADGAADFLVLRMQDLLPDAGGEIVLFQDLGESLKLVTQDHLAGQGESIDHVTASGLDVAGYSFCAFDSGITIFYPSTMKLELVPESA